MPLTREGKDTATLMLDFDFTSDDIETPPKYETVKAEKVKPAKKAEAKPAEKPKDDKKDDKAKKDEPAKAAD